MAEIVYRENALTGAVLVEIRNAIGWGVTPVFQAEAAIAHTRYAVEAVCGDRTVGVGRLVGDGALIWYLQDVIVLPEFQSEGIGRAVVERLVEYARAHSLPGTRVAVGLMAAKEKEGFYGKLGFRVRPNEQEGPGMMLNFDVPV